MSDDTDFEYLIVDSTIIRAHQHASGAKKRAEDQALGRSRGGLSTKIHLAVRGLGCPLRFVLTAGQKDDAPQADALIEELPAEVVMADTAYDSDRFRKTITGKGAKAVKEAWERFSAPSTHGRNFSNTVSTLRSTNGRA